MYNKANILGMMAAMSAMAYADPLQRNYMPERDVSPRIIAPIIPKGCKEYVFTEDEEIHELNNCKPVRRTDVIFKCHALNKKNVRKKFLNNK